MDTGIPKEIQNRFGESLETIIRRPNSLGARPAVILVPGIGADMHETKNSHDEIARILNGSGFLTVQFSFAGRGKSEGKYEDMTLTRQAQQLEDVIARVTQMPEADPKRIGIYAMSFGVATALRADLGGIKSACFVSGAYDPYISLQKLFSDRGEVHFDGMSWRKFSSGETIRLKPEFWRDLKSFDSETVLRPFSVPTCIIHGKADAKIPFSEAQQAYESVSSSKKNLILVEGGDHGIIAVPPSPRRVFLDAIVSWFAKTL